MVAFGRKAGIGTASRRVPYGTVGVLVMANFGDADQLRVEGARVRPVAGGRPGAGSCIGVVATDVPLERHQLRRVATRVGLGLARVGGTAHHGSGDLFCAFSTTARHPRRPSGIVNWQVLGDSALDAVFDAVVDATAEAVLDALCTADTTTGVDGHVAPALELR